LDGTTALRPAATPTNKGVLYLSNDENRVFVSTGAEWLELDVDLYTPYYFIAGDGLTAPAAPSGTLGPNQRFLWVGPNHERYIWDATTSVWMSERDYVLKTTVSSLNPLSTEYVVTDAVGEFTTDKLLLTGLKATGYATGSFFNTTNYYNIWVELTEFDSITIIDPNYDLNTQAWTTALPSKSSRNDHLLLTNLGTDYAQIRIAVQPVGSPPAANTVSVLLTYKDCYEPGDTL
jgi:hypothetical protein